jgi:Fungal specific transcription factor domain
MKNMKQGEEKKNLLLMIYRKLAGLALRQCVDLGYHRNTKHFADSSDILHIELRKRVFWSVFVLETQAAVMLGRPLAIPYQEVDAEVCFEIIWITSFTDCFNICIRV